jgi:hypothetical protein
MKAYSALTGRSRRSWLDAPDLAALLGHYTADFVCALQVQPKLFRGPEEAREADGCISADSAALEHDIVDSRHGNAKPLRQFVGGHAQWLQKLFPQNFARMNSPAGCAFSQNLFKSHHI